MSELIERQAAIEVIDKALSRTFAEPCGEMILKDAPSAQPEPQWIPVSERLPEESGYYITSNEYNGVGEDFYYDGHFWNADKNAYSVVAWMPKPEHYKPNEKQSGKEGA